MLAGIGAFEYATLFLTGYSPDADIDCFWIGRINHDAVNRQPSPFEARLEPLAGAGAVDGMEDLSVGGSKIEFVRVDRGRHKRAHITAPGPGHLPLPNFISTCV